MNKQNAFNIFFRYLFLLILGLGNLYIFYVIFTPLTIYPVKFILSSFYSLELSGNSLIINGYTIQLIEACIAGAAYYLLTILNLATSMPLKKRLYSLSFSFTIFLFLNISRIVILSMLFVNNSAYFDFSHKFFWYGLSTIFVVAIWFLTVYKFKIENIPFYSDFLSLKKAIKKN